MEIITHYVHGSIQYKFLLYQGDHSPKIKLYFKKSIFFFTSYIVVDPSLSSVICCLTLIVFKGYCFRNPYNLYNIEVLQVEQINGVNVPLFTWNR